MAKILTRQQNANIPSWALPYLINNDASGLSEDDKATVDKWYADWDNTALSLDGDVVISIVDPEAGEYYSRYPEFGLPCNCCECDITVLGADEPVEEQKNIHLLKQTKYYTKNLRLFDYGGGWRVQYTMTDNDPNFTRTLDARDEFFGSYKAALLDFNEFKKTMGMDDAKVIPTSPNM